MVGYAGDVNCEEAWALLKQDQNCFLLDVRSKAEWTFVGFADVSSAHNSCLFVEYQMTPTMAVNPNFVDMAASDIARHGGDKDSTILCLCRSGVRSISAAQALSASGFEKAYNVLGGFEGAHNAEQHRGLVDGWKAGGFPWIQK